MHSWPASAERVRQCQVKWQANVVPLEQKFMWVGCRGMFSKEVIGKMKKGAYLINNARGAIVEREAVVEACKSGQLGGTAPPQPA